jgi:CRP-like cAMP-binding protein
MPIIRPNSQKTNQDQTTFEKLVDKNPMAMSMMIDSVVNMMQNTRPPLQQDQSNTFAN